MLTRLFRRSSRDSELAQVAVMFVVLIPIFLGLGAIVLSIGNWYVHKRHLQTQVDAAVLASAPTFSNCFFDAAVANAGIIADAVPYSGDTARAALQTSTSYNQQPQTPSHAHVIFNPSAGRYWQASDGTDPSKAGTDSTNSYGGLDNGAGAPCSVSYLEAHATDDRAPLLFPWFPYHPSPKSTARVEIRETKSENGFLPLAVPEIDPNYVYAIFTDYALTGTQVPIKTQQLIKDLTNNACPPGGATFPYTCWITSAGQYPVTIVPNNTNSDGTGVVILVSKGSSPPSMGGTLHQICTQAPNIVQCYAGTGSNYDDASAGQGLSFIHSYRTVNGTLAAPRLRDVNLSGTTCTGGVTPGDLSAPYFTNDDNTCSATVTAVADFGSSWIGGPGNPTNDPTKKPNQGGICASVDGLTWTSTNAATGYTTWRGSLSIPVAGGPQLVGTMSWTDKAAGTSCSSPASGNFPGPAAMAYSADDAAGPVDYVHLTATGPNAGTSCPAGGTVGDADSVARGNYCYGVAVGIQQPLGLKPWNSADLVLRFASKAARKGGSGTANLNGSLLCDAGTTLTQTFTTGCRTFYGLNYDVWGTPTCSANGVKCWKDITCSSYGPSDLPPANYVNNPLPICVSAKNGQVQAFQAGIYNRFEDPGNGYGGCTPNRWPTTQAQADLFFKPVSKGGYDFTKDPRYITLIVTDNTAFSSPNTAEPVKFFAGFYVTGWDTGNGSGKPKGCYNEPGAPAGTCGAPNNDAHPILGCLAGKVTSSDNGDMWGHFVKQVVFSAAGNPGQNVCDLTSTSPATCVAVLTR